MLRGYVLYTQSQVRNEKMNKLLFYFLGMLLDHKPSLDDLR